MSKTKEKTAKPDIEENDNKEKIKAVVLEKPKENSEEKADLKTVKSEEKDAQTKIEKPKNTSKNNQEQQKYNKNSKKKLTENTRVLNVEDIKNISDIHEKKIEPKKKTTEQFEEAPTEEYKTIKIPFIPFLLICAILFCTFVAFIVKKVNKADVAVSDSVVVENKINSENNTIESKSIEEIPKIEENAKPITAIELDETNVKIGLGQNYILFASIKPEDATNQNVNWTSTDEKIVTVKDGQLKAVGLGTADIIVSSNNNKIEKCTVKVEKSTSYDTKYVTQEFNVRKGPGTSYQKLDTVKPGDEIEVLKETSNWAKIRIKKNGIAGYTVLKAYSSNKRQYIEGVPFINQMTIGYPTGCEAVSATMAAKFAGYNVSVEQIIAKTPTDKLGKRQETVVKNVEKQVINEETGEVETIVEQQQETIWVAENPFKYFVGYPTKTAAQGSYGCYAAPIVTALTASGVPCTNISGGAVENLYTYIDQGKPVIIWCRLNAKDINEGVTWHYPDGSGEYVELVGEHCAVLIGYDANYVYLNDPIGGQGTSQPRAKFESNWYKLHSQAVIVN